MGGAEYITHSHTGLKQKPRFAPPLILSVRVYFHAVNSHSYCYETLLSTLLNQQLKWNFKEKNRSRQYNGG